jgi:hypothetical protein
MAHCPFCKSTIDEELARFGGHCPKCVIEIPGDETPTDPGLGKRVGEAVETEQRRGFGVFAAVGGLVLVVLVGAGSVLWWRIDQQHKAELQAELKAQQDNDFFILPAEEHQLSYQREEEQQQAQAKAQNTGRAHTPRAGVTHVPSSGGASTSSGRNTFDFRGGAGEDEVELAEIEDRRVNVEVGSFGPSIPSISINRGSVGSMALSDPDEIRKSVGTALETYSKQMNTCYERRLKAMPNLAGTWMVSFAIGTDGRTSGVSVTPKTTSDAQLESCMAQAIAMWTFQPMASTQNFSKPYTFGTL